MHSILCPLPGFEINDISQHNEQIVIQANSTSTTACCPDCQQESQTVHSYYTRSPRELSCLGQPVQLELRVHRFRCRNAGCSRATFVERLPGFVPFRAQRTTRLTEVLRQLGLALGGEAGARLLVQLHLNSSADTLLRLIRQTPAPEVGQVRRLGVDDWAFRKGRVYGTLLVDLDRHQPVDLLPNREAHSLATWLQTHPEVQLITRDRAGAYAEGARLGAPQAIQVADRWHLLKNLGEALVLSYTPYQALLQPIKLVTSPTEVIQTLPERRPKPKRTSARLPSPAQQARQQRRAYWVQKFEQVHQLREQGLSISAIGRQTGLYPRTVRKYLCLTELPPKTSPKPGPRLIDPYRAYLRQRLVAEPVSSRRLWREIQAQGFKGGHSTVYAAVAQLRQEPGLPVAQPLAATPVPVKTTSLTPRTLAYLVLQRPEKLTDPQIELIQQACQQHPQLQQITQLAQAFAHILRTRQADQLDPWLDKVSASQIPGLISFVTGVRRDYDAVKAGLSLVWNNGQLEGQVNRLKCIKRQMYGRAKFDLLRLRVLQP
jgi:transposase